MIIFRVFSKVSKYGIFMQKNYHFSNFGLLEHSLKIKILGIVYCHQYTPDKPSVQKI